MDLVPLSGGVPASRALGARATPLDRLPGDRTNDPFLRLAAAWLLGYSDSTARAYRFDLEHWASWCTTLGIHPFAAERHHVDAWVRHLTGTPQPRTGRPAAPATVTRKLSALAGFYGYGIHDAQLLAHSPVASVRRPRVSDESAAIGLTADQLRKLLATADAHSPRSSALVTVLTFCGLRISEALNATVTDYRTDLGHRVLRVVRKGGKRGQVPLAPAVVRVLDTYLAGRTHGPLFMSSSGQTPYGYKLAYDQLQRLCRIAELPAGVTPHSLRHAYATQALSMGAALQDVQDAMGHADPRTTRRYDRNRHSLDRSPNYLLATSLSSATS